MEVERVIRGEIDGDELILRNGSWGQTGEADPRPVVEGDGALWLEPGDRALVAIDRGRRDPDRYYFFTGSSVFILNDGEVVDTDRPSPIIRELEALSEAEIKERAADETS